MDSGVWVIPRAAFEDEEANAGAVEAAAQVVCTAVVPKDGVASVGRGVKLLKLLANELTAAVVEVRVDVEVDVDVVVDVLEHMGARLGSSKPTKIAVMTTTPACHSGLPARPTPSAPQAALSLRFSACSSSCTQLSPTLRPRPRDLRG